MLKKNRANTISYAPLFDRLIDDDIYAISDPYDMSVLSLDDLYESIIKELDIILNTRPTAKSPAEVDDHQGGSDYDLPIYFGLNDFSWFDSSNDFSLYQISSKIADVIKRFEPRLHQPIVKIESMNKAVLGLNVAISGTIIADGIETKISFPITIKHLFSKK